MQLGQARTFGPYGGHGGSSFHVNGCHIRGILEGLENLLTALVSFAAGHN